MTPLRQAFIRELALRGMAARTQEFYIAAVRKLAEHYHLPPDQLSEEQLKEYLLYLSRDKQLAPSSVNQAVCAMRAFYGWVLHRDLGRLLEMLPRMRRQIRRPRVYSLKEIERLITEGTRSLRDRVLLMTVYATVLRRTAWKRESS